MAMTALKLGAPEDYMGLLQEHADAVNLPRIGVDENVALVHFIVFTNLILTFREGTGDIHGLFWTDCRSYRRWG